MKKLSILITLLYCFISFCYPQQDIPAARNSMTMVFYNVENLFDIEDDANVDDQEFLPDSPREWNEQKYRKKIADIARVISSVNNKELPSLIGLAEIENEKVLKDLAESQKLRRGNYEIVHYDSPDERGIDVALLYDPGELQIIVSKKIPVYLSSDTSDKTRDILYASFKADDNNIYHVFVNHWPSRSPSQEESEIKRISTAITLRKEVDFIFNNDNKARIIVLGDFNDEPTNRSILQILNAADKRKNIHYRDLYNLMYYQHNMGDIGSITYKNQWQMFDQIIVSYSLFEKGPSYYLTYSDGMVYRDEDLVVKDRETGSVVLNRTYSGTDYTGGTSDHLPVYIILRKEKN